MAQLRVKDLYAMVSDKNLGPKAKIEFTLGNWRVTPQDIAVSAQEPSSYDRNDLGTIVVNISAEFIEARVKERMKQMFDAQIDAMFQPKETPSAAS